MRTTDTASQVARLTVTTSAAPGALASVQVDQSRFLAGATAIFQLGTYTPATPAAGDLQYSGGNVRYYDSSNWQVLMQLGPSSPQASSSANPGIYLNETNAGAPDLLHFQVGGATRFRIVNSGSFTAYGDGLPSGNNSLDLGSGTLAWNEAYLGLSVSFGTGATRTSLTYAAPTAARTITLPDATGTVLLTSTASGNYVSSITGTNGITPTSASTAGVTLGLSTTSTDATSYVMNQTAGDQSASFRVSGTGTFNTAVNQALTVTNSVSSAANTYGARFVSTQTLGGQAFTNYGLYAEANFGGGTNPGAAFAYGAYLLGNHSGTGDAQADVAGVYARGTGITGRNKYGVYATVDSTSAYSGSNYAVYASASGTASAADTCYGIWAGATGGDTNWAGYFNADVAVVGDVTLGSSAQWFATGGDENLRIIRGFCQSSGAISYGTGFSCTKTGTGAYRITYNVAFPAVATAVVTPFSGSARFACLTSVSSTQFNLEISDASGNPIDSFFSFVATGPK